MINGYKEYLQNVLGSKYLVVLEEKFDYNTDKNVAILSEFQGTNFKTCILLNYQLMVLTNEVEETMQELQRITWLQNEQRLSTSEFSYIKQLMTQPINQSNFMQIHNEYQGSISINITLIASFNLMDIKEFYIDNELQNPTTFNISYQTVPTNNRTNDEELNTTNINEANLQYQITMPMENNTFFKKCRSIMFGNLPKDTSFNIKIKYTDDYVFEDTFKLSSDSLAYERSALTNQTYTFLK